MNFLGIGCVYMSVLGGGDLGGEPFGLLIT